jgi:hypothetical protein
MFGVHADLRRHVLVSLVASAALGAAGVAMLIARAANLPAVRGIPTVVLVGFGVVALGVAYLGAVVGPRWFREASRIVASARPVPGTAALRLDSSSDSTSLYARLEPSPGSSGFSSHEIAVLIPRWDVAELLRSLVPVSIYIDPATSRIAAIETGQGLLWVLSGSQASD